MPKEAYPSLRILPSALAETQGTTHAGAEAALDAARQGGTVNLGYVFKNPPPGSYDGVRGAGSGIPRPTSFTLVRGIAEAARAAIVGRWAAQYEARAYKYELLANGRSLRYDFCWLEGRMVPLGFRLIHLCRMPESFVSARAERLKVSGNPAQVSWVSQEPERKADGATRNSRSRPSNRRKLCGWCMRAGVSRRLRNCLESTAVRCGDYSRSVAYWREHDD
jgi:hypothetical protein